MASTTMPQPDPMRINLPSKAWMAGVLETRGKIRFTNDPSRKTNQLVLQVRTSHLGVVERMCALTGCRFAVEHVKAIVTADRRPCTEHCTEAHSHVVREVPEHAVWSISGAGAAIVLTNLAPFLVTDGPAMLAVADNILANLPTSGRGRHAVDMVILRLKKLGWKIPEQAMEGFVGERKPAAQRGTGGKFVKSDTDESTVAGGQDAPVTKDELLDMIESEFAGAGA